MKVKTNNEGKPIELSHAARHKYEKAVDAPPGISYNSERKEC